jgi:transcriptional regulator with XRE-family HTH domain
MELTEEELRRLYLDEGLTVLEIGDRFGLNNSTITRRLVKMGISRRRFTSRSGQIGRKVAPEETQAEHREYIEDLVRKRKELEVEILDAVADARLDLVPWKVIADAFGYEVNYAIKKFSKKGET